MRITRIPSENPKDDQWKLLSQFAYPQNIARFLQEKGRPSNESDLINFIAGCIGQAQAYFAASETSPLDIAPVLVYYGATNLLAGAAALITGQHKHITSHGVRSRSSDLLNRVADFEFVPLDPESGALQYFADIFSDGCDLTNSGPWILSEIFASLPDLSADYLNCYPDAKPHTIPIEVVPRYRASLERIAHTDVVRFANIAEVFAEIVHFRDAYIQPQGNSGTPFIILYPKRSGIEIGTYSIFGRKYLQIAHGKNGHLVSPGQLIIMFMGLFALGYLSRYHPEFWNPFTRSDTTGERLVVERFLAICQRFLPNLVLGAIREEAIKFIRTGDVISQNFPSLTEADLKLVLQEMKAKGELE